jgi:superfamily II RNA helicase
MGRLKTLEDHRSNLLQRLQMKMEGCRCDGFQEILDRIEKRSHGYQSLGKLRRRKKRYAEENFKESHLNKGQLFLDKHGKLYCSLGLKAGDGDTWCECLKIKGSAISIKKKPRPVKLSLDQIDAILDGSLALNENMEVDDWIQLKKQAKTGQYNILPYPDKLTEEQKAKLHALTTEMSGLQEELAALPCKECSHFSLCHQGKKNHFKKLIERVRQADVDLEDARYALWKEFKRHLDFLVLQGFAEEDGRLTSDGVWAAKLRLDQPLLIAELIRKGLLNELTPELLAGVIAPFVNDKFRDVEIDSSMDWEKAPLRKVYFKMQAAIEEMLDLKKRHGFQISITQFWPAAALFSWACGMSWEGVMKLTSVDEGDLAMLIFRTADNLRQIVSLEGTHPALADKARHAIELILREPVIIPT